MDGYIPFEASCSDFWLHAIYPMSGGSRGLCIYRVLDLNQKTVNKHHLYDKPHFTSYTELSYKLW